MPTFELKCPDNGDITTTDTDPLVAKNTKCPDCGKAYKIRIQPKSK